MVPNRPVLEVVIRCNRLAAQWGGRVALVDDLPVRRNYDIDNNSHAPFDNGLGVNHRSKIVYVVEQDVEEPGGIIHEMGHVFAAVDMRQEEWRFFGWEYVVARQLRLVKLWDRSCTNYVIPGPYNAEWGDLDRRTKQNVLTERIGSAVSDGLLSLKLRPKTLRVQA